MLTAAQWWTDRNLAARLSAAPQSGALPPQPDGFLPPPPLPAEWVTFNAIYLQDYVCVVTGSAL